MFAAFGMMKSLIIKINYYYVIRNEINKLYFFGNISESSERYP